MASQISCLQNRAHYRGLYRILDQSNESNLTNSSVTELCVATPKKPSPKTSFQ